MIDELKPFININVKTNTIESDVLEWCCYGVIDHLEELEENKEVFKIIDGQYYINKDQQIIDDIFYRLEDQFSTMYYDHQENNKKYKNAKDRVIKKIKSKIN